MTLAVALIRKARTALFLRKEELIMPAIKKDIRVVVGQEGMQRNRLKLSLYALMRSSRFRQKRCN
jgi:hypothetical protein